MDKTDLYIRETLKFCGHYPQPLLESPPSADEILAYINANGGCVDDKKLRIDFVERGYKLTNISHALICLHDKGILRPFENGKVGLHNETSSI